MSNLNLKIYNPNIEYYGNLLIKKEFNEITDDLEKDIYYLCDLFISNWTDYDKFTEKDLFHFHKDMKITFAVLDKFYNNEIIRTEIDNELKNEKDEKVHMEVKEFYKICENIKKLKDIEIENLQKENFSLKPILVETVKYFERKNNEMKELNNSMKEMGDKLDELHKTLVSLTN